MPNPGNINMWKWFGKADEEQEEASVDDVDAVRVAQQLLPGLIVVVVTISSINIGGWSEWDINVDVARCFNVVPELCAVNLTLARPVHPWTVVVCTDREEMAAKINETSIVVVLVSGPLMY